MALQTMLKTKKCTLRPLHTPASSILFTAPSRLSHIFLAQPRVLNTIVRDERKPKNKINNE